MSIFLLSAHTRHSQAIHQSGPSGRTLIRVSLFLIMLIMAFPRAADAQQLSPASPQAQSAVQQSQMPMKQQAQMVIQQAVKVEVNVAPRQQGKKPGEPVQVEIVLKDGKGQPVGAPENTTIELKVTPPSGKASTSKVQLAPGEKSKSVTIVLNEPGPSQLSVRQVDNRLVSSTNYVLAASPTSARKKKATGKVKGIPGKGSWLLPAPAGGARLIYASFPVNEQQPDNNAGAALDDGHPRLMLRISGEDDAGGVRADGISAARVQVFYMADTPPGSDVKIWLQQTNGDVTPNPLILPRGTSVAEAKWTSKFPVEAARLSIATVSPRLEFLGPSEATVRFGQPILGIGFVNPPVSISIVDRVDLVARFYDSEGNPIQTNVKRPFRFASNSPALRLLPENDEVTPGKSDFSTKAQPTGLGICNIEASTPGYRAISYQIKITGTVVLLLCLLGGILGGLAAYINSQGKLWMRIVSGVIVGLVASWAYVYVGLSKTDSIIAHNQLSVLIVSILAAFAGVKVLGVITKSLNLGF